MRLSPSALLLAMAVGLEAASPMPRQAVPYPSAEWHRSQVEVRLGSRSHPRPHRATDTAPVPTVVPDTTPEGRVSDWSISRPYPAERVRRDTYPHFYAIFGAGWHDVGADPGGMIDIGRNVDRRSESGDLVLARARVHAAEETRSTLTLGYSNDVDVYINGRWVFSGRNRHMSPGSSSPEWLHPSDTIPVRFARGVNEILLMVTEGSLGWGFALTVDPPAVGVRQDHDAVTEVWDTPPMFLTSESAVFDQERNVLYVSSFDNEFAQRSEATGFISRVSPEGVVLEREWVSGLHAPTGVAVWSDTLYVVERRHLTAIDILSASVLHRWPIPGVEFPNDLAVGPDGSVYITDTRTSNWEDSRIYRFKQGQFEVFANEGISRANGLCVHKDQLLVGSSGDGYLKRVDLQSRKVTPVISLGAGIIDGIRVDEQGNYLVSHWEGQVYRISAGGEVVQVLDTQPFGRNTADFEYLPDRRLLVIPTFLANGLTAFHVGS